MVSMPPIRVSIVNDYEVVVAGVAAMLEPFSDRVTVVETEAGGVPEIPADIVLFDTFAGRRRSLARIDTMSADQDMDKVVLYTWDIPKEFARDVDLRAIDGVILKDATAVELVEKLERVQRGEFVGASAIECDDNTTGLTEREREVLALLSEGATNREIAGELYLSVDTVKTHVRKLFAKLGVTNRTQAAIVARDRGIDLTKQQH